MGRVRDVVVTFSATRREPRVIGLVVEVIGRRRVFVPMTRVTSVEGGQVITTGLVNMRRFEQRSNESLVLAELVERLVTVTLPDSAPPEVFEATVEDVAIERASAATGSSPRSSSARRARPRAAACASPGAAARRSWSTSPR